MKKSQDLALFEQVLAATPLDAVARRSALRAFEAYCRACFIAQYGNGGRGGCNHIAVAVAAEALGFRDIRLKGKAGMMARAPDGSHITVFPVCRRRSSPPPAG